MSNRCSEYNVSFSALSPRTDGGWSVQSDKVYRFQPLRDGAFEQI